MITEASKQLNENFAKNDLSFIDAIKGWVPTEIKEGDPIWENLWDENKIESYEIIMEAKITEIVNLEKSKNGKFKSEIAELNAIMWDKWEEILKTNLIDPESLVSAPYPLVLLVEDVNTDSRSCKINIYQGTRTRLVTSFYFQPSEKKLILINK